MRSISGGTLLLACAMAHPIHAQTTPEAAAQGYAEALRVDDWAAAARAMHPEALHQLRSLWTPMLDGPRGDEVANQVFGVTAAAAKAMPDTVLFADFLQHVLTGRPELGEVLHGAKLVALGHVAGGGDTVLVVSRIAFAVRGVTVTTYEVMPFIAVDGRWLGLLKSDFTNMAAAMRAALEAHRS